MVTECDRVRKCMDSDGAAGAQNNMLVCRIRSYHERLVHRQPYKDRDTSSTVGTGFVVRVGSATYVATAFHVIDCTVKVEVVFDSFLAGKRLQANVIGGNPHLDVALLSVDELETLATNQHTINTNSATNQHSCSIIF